MIYLDANVLIRFVEGMDAVRQPIEARLRGEKPPFATSRLTRLECRCKPLRENNAVLLGTYDTLFGGVELVLIELDAAVIEAATSLRARYGFKTPDAIHLASAVISGCTAFLTADRQLLRCAEAHVKIV